MDCCQIKNIEKFLQKEAGKERSHKYQRLVILSDSKGRYLRTEADNVNTDGIEIIWWAVGGRSTKDGVRYLTENIAKLNDGKKTLVLFWHFTCDLTKKIQRLIYPRYADIEELTDNLRPTSIHSGEFMKTKPT